MLKLITAALLLCSLAGCDPDESGPPPGSTAPVPDVLSDQTVCTYCPTEFDELHPCQHDDDESDCPAEFPFDCQFDGVPDSCDFGGAQ
jgi:nitrous oxide reductase accessory protein NosL